MFDETQPAGRRWRCRQRTPAVGRRWPASEAGWGRCESQPRSDEGATGAWVRTSSTSGDRRWRHRGRGRPRRRVPGTSMVVRTSEPEVKGLPPAVATASSRHASTISRSKRSTTASCTRRPGGASHPGSPTRSAWSSEGPRRCARAGPRVRQPALRSDREAHSGPAADSVPRH